MKELHVRDFPQAIDVADSEGRFVAALKFGEGFRLSRKEAHNYARLFAQAPKLCEAIQKAAEYLSELADLAHDPESLHDLATASIGEMIDELREALPVLDTIPDEPTRFYVEIIRHEQYLDEFGVYERYQLVGETKTTTRRVASFNHRGEAAEYADWRNGFDDVGLYRQLKAERAELIAALEDLVQQPNDWEPPYEKARQLLARLK